MIWCGLPCLLGHRSRHFGDWFDSFLPGPVLVIWILLHVQLSQTLCLINERLSLLFWQHLPPPSQPLGNLCIVHIWLLFADLAPLYLGPHHKGVHWSFDVIGIILLRLSSIRIRCWWVLIDQLRSKHWYSTGGRAARATGIVLLRHHYIRFRTFT